MTAKIRATKNPFFISDKDDLMRTIMVKKFHSERFRITDGDITGDNKRYEDLMENMYPYKMDSKYELSSITGSPISKTFTKDGDVIIHVEYIELARDEPEEDKDKREY